MRLDELDKRIDKLADQIKAIRSTQNKKATPAPAAKPGKAVAKQDVQWRTQKATEWTYSDGTKMVSSRGLPAGWLDEFDKFIPLKYNSWDPTSLRQVLMQRRYDTPLYK